MCFCAFSVLCAVDSFRQTSCVLMGVLFLSLLATVIVDQCFARTSSRRVRTGGSSVPVSTLAPSIAIPIFVVLFVTVVIVIICMKKRANRARAAVQPFAPPIPLNNYGNPYANPAPPYGQPPPYAQYPPAGAYPNPSVFGYKQ